MGTLDELVRTKRTLICVGPGGVGKTTTSAAVALRAAALGRRTLVLTVDPAFIKDAGLSDSLTPARQGGLASMLQRMQQAAKRYAD